MCPPEDLFPKQASPEFSDLHSAFMRAAAASAWAWLASGIRIVQAEALLEYFGLRRVSVSLGRLGIEDTEVQQPSIDLYRWATADAARQPFSFTLSPLKRKRPLGARPFNFPLARS
jgi:hypothetical protein